MSGKRDDRTKLAEGPDRWAAAKATHEHRPFLDYFTYEVGSVEGEAEGASYRGEVCNFNPYAANLAEEDALEKYVLAGWLPERPFIDKSHVLTTFGSCFADYIAEYLKAKGYCVGGRDVHHYNSHVIRFSDGIVNTFAILQQFAWAWEDHEFSQGLWYGHKGLAADNTPEVRESTRAVFAQTDAFIITLGLSEVWYHKKTGEVLWRSVPRDMFDPEIHGFRVSTVAENRENLERIYELIRANKPADSPIIFTLSPVPLVATFRPVSCVTANSVSKAILRAALDEFYRSHEGDERLFYFPSYEIVKEFCSGAYDDDNRHVKEGVVELVLDAFDRHFLAD